MLSTLNKISFIILCQNYGALRMVKDNRVHLYDLSASGSLAEKKVLQHAGAITSVNFSPNGKFLVATDIARKANKLINYS